MSVACVSGAQRDVVPSPVFGTFRKTAKVGGFGMTIRYD
jgi:hypothetical protein